MRRDSSVLGVYASGIALGVACLSGFLRGQDFSTTVWRMLVGSVVGFALGSLLVRGVLSVLDNRSPEPPAHGTEEGHDKLIRKA